MTKTVGLALRDGRKKKKMTLTAAAMKLFISDRHLRRYEDGEAKENPQLIADAAKLYNDVELAQIYLENNPVYKLLYGGDSLLKKLIEKLRDAMQATMDIFSDMDRRGGFAY